MKEISKRDFLKIAPATIPIALLGGASSSANADGHVRAIMGSYSPNGPVYINCAGVFDKNQSNYPYMKIEDHGIVHADDHSDDHSMGVADKIEAKVEALCKSMFNAEQIYLKELVCEKVVKRIRYNFKSIGFFLLTLPPQTRNAIRLYLFVKTALEPNAHETHIVIPSPITQRQ